MRSPSKLRLALEVALALFAFARASANTTDTTDDYPQRPAIVDYSTSEAGNPFVDGWYADPDTAIYQGLYWVFPTSSYPYEEQTYLDAFSSPDLIHWTKYPNILTIKDVTWAKKAVWAPAPAFRNGKYYIYFGANDIQEGEPEQGVIGGIGVAVADKPQGPYVDAIGKPLIGAYNNSAQPIDQDVFIDDDGQAYIYYGGHGHANVAKLKEDMISFDTFEDGTTFKEITPKDYVEGPQMLKRNGKYYLMWSEGGWTGPDYRVSYAVAASPLGPFFGVTGTRILQQDSAVAKGSGHNGVIHVPGTDIYYIVYHRRPLSEDAGEHRVLCYDRMYFKEDGSIEPVKMLVKDDFVDGDMVGWKVHPEGSEGVQIVDNKLGLESHSRSGTIVALDTNFTDQTYDATVILSDSSDDFGTSAGLIFRATNVTSGPTARGYYAGLSTSGRVIIMNLGNGTTVHIEGVDIKPEIEHRVRVSAIGADISVFVDDFASPVLTLRDATYTAGTNGVAVFNTQAKFGNVSIAEGS
ncbi:carbohydrate-binding module family 66 protein [Karstenula rhodostoma CBS 690.94]|uniref:Carbohydrate-binding module family 66 protein n=1 Tax=Karstenula rhodostoma CBS 690.94 TaxID=1392251 RepID=A0A9P4U8F2_9PLEO|nr:carbohydrate-binding module family 66 protein [Karstenula rhodostoma CBS 690.94]